MLPAPLTPRALGRAFLARQLLAERARTTPLEAVEHLVGLQAQAPRPPYFGLWTRVAGFDAGELSTLLQERRVVRICVMRGTVHLVSDRDAVQLYPLTRSAHERAFASGHGKRLGGADPAAVVEAARELLKEGPMAAADFGPSLHRRWPEAEERSLGMAARYLLPLVQLPPRGLWGRSGRPVLATVESWLDRPLAVEPSLETMVLRYMGAFGPASVRDVQTWSGLTRLGEVVERLRPQLRVFTDEAGRELFDLPDAPRPDPELPLPVRFLAEYDNAILSHADRTRIMDEEVRRALAGKNGQVPGTFLVDGRVHGTWKAETGQKSATLTLTCFGALSGEDRDALEKEGQALLAFATDGAPGPHRIVFTTAA
ncbi:winged helix DNA-binding domain-containing protein [Streptomyces iconiensis]|uniref:Winged helix DNA-binding domain-containing protein n=1 Tax=Streptomyces iconiensis TaxID=1384038 RepID=A0ABT6ZW34_9ACTN|nr:winged helix DNA-binding domain-containing protein [Streptomyces iconiensis]MDJ1133282.1 winged helix DNA-binding domain-containing protein [Streptomyces iconiensis]